MEDPIRSGTKFRTSKISQKLSSLKAIIRRRTKDDNANNPYSAHGYMSQPVLALSNPVDIDADDVSLTINKYPTQRPILGHARKVSAQSTLSNSSFPIHDAKSQLNSNNNPTASLPDSIETLRESTPNSLRPGGVRAWFKPSKYSAIERPSPPPSILLPPIPTVPLPPIPTIPLSSSSSSTVGPNATTTPKINQLYASIDRPALMTYSSTPALTSKFSSATSDGCNGIDGTDGSSDSLPALSVPTEAPSSVPGVPRRNPKLTVITTLDDSNNAGTNSTINTSSSQQPLFPLPIEPRRTVSTAPRLSLPPSNYRFSLNLIDGYSARMSPSVILRPPPLPLLNLPVLPTSTSIAPGIDGASSRRSRRAGLMSMPALPRQGSSRGAAGHEEFDDVEEDEDEDEDDGDGGGDDDDDDDDDGDDGDGGIGPDSAPLEDKVDTPRSGDSSASEMIPSSHSRARTPSTSSCDTARADEPSSPHQGYLGDLTRPPERRFSRSPYLPPVDMSRIDLSFLNSPPSNKGKTKELTEDAGRTPIAIMKPNRNTGTAGNSTPTAFSAMNFFIPEETATAWAPSPVITKGSQANSPIQTPRPGGHSNPTFPVPVPRSPQRVLPTRSMENRLSVSMITGMHKHASRSLVDIHALEKKEKVEQMVRKEEEGAEEERKRRVKSIRMSMRVDGVNTTTTPYDQQSSRPDIDATFSLRKQMSLGPYCVDGDGEASGAASSSDAKEPKKTNNRRSMAPAYDTIIPLRRRLSMPTFNATSTPPPPYPDLFPGQTYGVKHTQIQPRDDEGREKLPAYSNSIYLKAILPRKFEFSQPGVQAKDRKWKRVLCVLEGTSLKIYKPPGVSVIGGWWESKVGIGDIAVAATTTGSFNSGGGRPRIQDAGRVANATGESKVESERVGEGMREAIMGTWPVPSQSNNATPSNQRQGHRPTTSSSSYPSSATPSGGGSGDTSSTSTGGVPTTKSALNLAVHLLKPSSRGHGRTISDVGQPSNTLSVSRSPRPSLNIPRNGRSTPTPTIASTTTGTSVSSSRSPSPMFASSSSLLTTPATSGSSQRSTSFPIGGGGYAASAFSMSKGKGKKKAEDSDSLLGEPDANSLIRAYTMQQAECGLGTDYVKRKHVIRVRLEGEQFLLQAKDVDSVIEWIEGLQAATNVAMDLDERPMPRGPLFPRRRRRRRVVAATTVDVAGIPQIITTRISPSGNTPVDASQLAPPLVWSV